MVYHDGIWLPAGEQHLVRWMSAKQQRRNGRPGYQLHKLEAVLALVPAHRRLVAVDVGAHVGLWSMHLADEFARVIAFEPVAAHRECFERNLAGAADRVELMPVALGREHGSLPFVTDPSSSGDTHVAAHGELPIPGHDCVPVVPLDAIVDWCDLLKIDCEGYELHVLEGARELLLKSRPAVIVEQKPGKGAYFGLDDHAAVRYLESLGASVVREMSGDFLMAWEWQT